MRNTTPRQTSSAHQIYLTTTTPHDNNHSLHDGKLSVTNIKVWPTTSMRPNRMSSDETFCRFYVGMSTEKCTLLSTNTVMTFLEQHNKNSIISPGCARERVFNFRLHYLCWLTGDRTNAEKTLLQIGQLVCCGVLWCSVVVWWYWGETDRSVVTSFVTTLAR